MGLGKFIGKILMGTVDLIDDASEAWTNAGKAALEPVNAAKAEIRREERKLQQALEEEELRKDRQLRDLQIEQLLNEKVNKEKIAAKKKITMKSPQTLLGKKRVIDKKLKDGLITERTAVIQTNKAIAAEKMRLIIKNQLNKKKVKSKMQPENTSNTSKELDYVEKLKEIKYLRGAGEITQAEFRKLKKKIIDSI